MTGCATIYCGSASCVLRDVRCHVDLAQFHDEVSCIEALIGCQRDRARSVRVSLDHVERSQSFSMARDLRQPRIDEEAMAVLHQGMTDEAELGLHARSLAVEVGIGISGRGVGLVGPLLAAEVDFLVPCTVSRRWLLTAAPGLAALQARPGFHPRSLHPTLIVGAKP